MKAIRILRDGTEFAMPQVSAGTIDRLTADWLRAGAPADIGAPYCFDEGRRTWPPVRVKSGVKVLFYE